MCLRPCRRRSPQPRRPRALRSPRRLWLSRPRRAPRRPRRTTRRPHRVLHRLSRPHLRPPLRPRASLPTLGIWCSRPPPNAALPTSICLDRPRRPNPDPRRFTGSPASARPYGPSLPCGCPCSWVAPGSEAHAAGGRSSPRSQHGVRRGEPGSVSAFPCPSFLVWLRLAPGTVVSSAASRHHAGQGPSRMVDHPYRDAASGPRCPLDGTRLREQEHASGERVDFCAACHGSWLPEDALSKALRWAQRTPPERGVQAEPRSVLMTEMARQKHRDALKCPACGGELIAEERGSHSYVLVDVCPEGCGSWLDAEELRRLIEHARGVRRA